MHWIDFTRYGLINGTLMSEGLERPIPYNGEQSSILHCYLEDFGLFNDGRSPLRDTLTMPVPNGPFHRTRDMGRFR